ncbi:hypothetical protein ACFWB1_35950 [Streptomyces goshikiensis]|uniref:hypothetical protein n=1 Tax=Streptomyces goshikiensis TaxID=1942 RepID=UPI003691BB26
MVDVGLAAVAVTATVFVMNKDGCFHRRHLLAESRRHLALVQRGRRREPGLDEKIVDAALAEYCADITEARTERGEEAGYRQLGTRRPAALPDTGRRVRPNPEAAPGPAAPFLPMEPGEWDIPRVPLEHDRAVIAARVLTVRLRTARRTGRPLYDATAHQPSPEQLVLFTRDQSAAAKAGPAVDLAALRTAGAGPPRMGSGAGRPPSPRQPAEQGAWVPPRG